MAEAAFRAIQASTIRMRNTSSGCERVFRAANSYRMAIVVHMRVPGQMLPYGKDAALVLLNELVPAA